MSAEDVLVGIAIILIVVLGFFYLMDTTVRIERIEQSLHLAPCALDFINGKCK